MPTFTRRSTCYHCVCVRCTSQSSLPKMWFGWKHNELHLKAREPSNLHFFCQHYACIGTVLVENRLGFFGERSATGNAKQNSQQTAKIPAQVPPGPAGRELCPGEHSVVGGGELLCVSCPWQCNTGLLYHTLGSWGRNCPVDFAWVMEKPGSRQKNNIRFFFFPGPTGTTLLLSKHKS